MLSWRGSSIFELYRDCYSHMSNEELLKMYRDQDGDLSSVSYRCLLEELRDRDLIFLCIKE